VIGAKHYAIGYRLWGLGDGMKKKIESYEDLEVYQRFCDLHIEGDR
jgi:hypothetical protein